MNDIDYLAGLQALLPHLSGSAGQRVRRVASVCEPIRLHVPDESLCEVFDHFIKHTNWEFSVNWSIPFENRHGFDIVFSDANSINQAKRTRQRLLEDCKGVILRLGGQPPATRLASALPYKILLKNMDFDLAYDSDVRVEYMLIGTDENDSKRLMEDVSDELAKATDAHLAFYDQSLYMYFKTSSCTAAKVMKNEVVAWLKKRIAEIEQPPAEPMQDPFTQEGRDEILQASHQMPPWNSDEFFGKDLSAGLRAAVERRAAELKAKDEEIARLTKLNDKCVEWMRDNDLVKKWNDLYTKEVAPLKKQIEMMTPPAALIDRLDKLEAENDRLKQGMALAADRPAMPRPPKVGDVILITQTDNVPFQIRAVIFHMEEGYFWLVVDERCGHQVQMRIEEYGQGWIYADSSAAVPKDVDQPATRTAADAKVGDPVWFFYDDIGYSGVIFSIGKGVTIQSHSRAYFSKGIDSYGTDWGVIGRDTK